MPPNIVFDAAAFDAAVLDVGDTTCTTLDENGLPVPSTAVNQGVGGGGQQQQEVAASAGFLPNAIHDEHDQAEMDAARSPSKVNSWDNLADVEAPPRGDEAVRGAGDEKSDDHHEEQYADKNEADRSHHIRRYIRTQASKLSITHKDMKVDEERLQQAVKDAGEHSFGIVGVEVWLLDEDDGWLSRPAGGWWNCEFMENVEPLLAQNGGRQERAYPGVGLAGTLWSESSPTASTAVRQSTASSPRKSRSRPSIVSMSFSRENSIVGNMPDLHPQHSPMQWRDIRSLLEDPDTAKDDRLIQYLDSGFGLAAGIPFHSWYFKGIVVYLARPLADTSLLECMENQVFLACSAQIVGSILACTDARRASLLKKQADCDLAFCKARKSILHEQSRSYREPAEPEQAPALSPPIYFWKKHVQPRIHSWLHKCMGGNLQIPPAMSWHESFYTWLGCFVGLLILSTMNEYTKELSGDDLSLLIGPFGALMTLLYGLSSAPASQPRNVVLGQIVAGAVSMAFTYVPESIMSTWMRTAVGPAFAITTMVKLGFPHPPAGAHSVIYASGQYGWTFYCIVVLGSIISVIPATMVNNLSPRRQYPTFWGYSISFLETRSRELIGKKRYTEKE